MYVPFIGTSWGVWIGISAVLFGFAGFMTGQALAQTWRPFWHAPVYCLLLAIGSRFLIFALFEGRLVWLTGYAADWAVQFALAALAYRATRARQMVVQYPWLYERAGLFSWRAKA